MIIDDIEKNFNKIVINPQNTLCADNPDVLVLDGDVLVGIYIPRAIEKKDINHLYRRVLASRLSYVPNMKTVIYTDNDNLHEDSVLNGCVNIILPENDLSLRKSFDNLKNTHMDVELSSRIRTKFLKRFATNLTVFFEIRNIPILRNNYKKNAFNTAETTRILYPGRNKTTVTRTNKIKVYQDRFIYCYDGMANNLNRNSNSFCTESFFLDFKLDNNHLHFSDKSFKYPKIMNSELVEGNQLPDKLLKNLCYYGYIPLGINNDNELGYFFNIYESIYHGKKK